MDAGIDTCRERILAWYESRLSGLVPESTQKDAKTRLQEYMQAKRQPLPEYQVVSIEGDPHDPTFRVHCTISLIEEPFVGVASNRRKAEQIAAETALEQLGILLRAKKGG